MREQMWRLRTPRTVRFAHEFTKADIKCMCFLGPCQGSHSPWQTVLTITFKWIHQSRLIVIEIIETTEVTWLQLKYWMRFSPLVLPGRWFHLSPSLGSILEHATQAEGPGLCWPAALGIPDFFVNSLFPQILRDWERHSFGGIVGIYVGLFSECSVRLNLRKQFQPAVFR